MIPREVLFVEVFGVIVKLVYSEHGGGSSSIVKVPGDLPHTRVYLFGPLV